MRYFIYFSLILVPFYNFLSMKTKKKELGERGMEIIADPGFTKGGGERINFLIIILMNKNGIQSMI